MKNFNLVREEGGTGSWRQRLCEKVEKEREKPGEECLSWGVRGDAKEMVVETEKQPGDARSRGVEPSPM